MQMNFRKLFWITATAVVVVLLALAFRPRPVAVDAAEVTSGEMTVTVADEARTRVRNVYELAAPVGGHLLRIDHKPGAHVHAGQVVARVLPSDPPFLDARARAEAQAAVESAEAALSAARASARSAAADLELARTEADRIETLHERALASRESLDRALRQRSVAEAALESARENVRMREAMLEAARVRLVQPGARDIADAAVEVPAPIEGRVLTVAQESESVVAAGAVLMTLGNPANLEIVAELLSTDAVQVRPGADVFVEDWGGPEALRGGVRLVEPNGFLKVSALGVEEQRVNVVIDFTDPPSAWAQLGHGYRVEVAIVVWREQDVIQVPVAALFRSEGRWAVFQIDSGRAVLTPVEVGRDNGRVAQILSGVEPGQAIILYPSEDIGDGVRVRLRD